MGNYILLISPQNRRTNGTQNEIEPEISTSDRCRKLVTLKIDFTEG